MLGIYHPFTFVERKEDIDDQIVYKLKELKVILTGQFSSIKLVNLLTGAETSPTVSDVSYTLNGSTIYASRVTATLTNGVKYYLDVDGVYFSDVITKSVCNKEVSTFNSCSNEFWDWDSDPAPLTVYFNNAQDLTPTFEDKIVSIVGVNGIVNKVKDKVIKYRIQFLAPTGYDNILNSLSLNSNVTIANIGIKNISIEKSEQDNGRYAVFTMTYQFISEVPSSSGCCEVVNIDDILSPEYSSGGEECDDLTSEVINTDGTLSVDLTDPPVGTPTYKWYLNNVFLSSAPTIEITSPGNYRAEIIIGTCKTTASYFKDNPCAIFQIDLTKAGNEINVTASNIPEDETVTYSVVLNGVEVSTTLPYTIEETGTYYVYATAGDCLKSKAIYVELEDEDCDFTISIDETDGVLSAVTDAGTPTYLWELETGTGKVTVGTAIDLTIGAKGIYWLTITNGSCSKEEYIYKEPLPSFGSCVLARSTGTEFTVYGIDLLEITNYPSEVLLTVNGLVHTFVSGTPTLSNTYGVKVDGKIIFANSFTNALIIITLI